MERLEKLTGPDRRLDLEIARVLCPDVLVMRQRADDSGADPYTYWEYTGSIDAAVALVEEKLPGWQFDVSSTHAEFLRPGEHRYSADLAGPVTYYRDEETGCDDLAFPSYSARGASAPLAILSCLFRALTVNENG